MGGKRARRDASTADWRGGFDYVVAWLDRMAEGAAKRALVFEAELKNGEYLRAERWPSREAFLAANCLTTLDSMRAVSSGEKRGV